MTAGRKPTRSNRKNNSQSNKSIKKISSRDKGKYIDYKEKRKKGDPLPSFREDAIRLNKFLSNAGICSLISATRAICASALPPCPLILPISPVN